MRFVLGLAAVLFIMLVEQTSFTLQQNCTYLTLNDIAELIHTTLTAEEGIPSSSSLVVNVTNYTLLCLSHSVGRDRYRHASFIAEYSCYDSDAQCVNQTIIQQFATVCNESVWSVLANEPLEHLANFSTPLREDCESCLPPSIVQNVTGYDPITYCLPCDSMCDEGLMSCYGPSHKECCNYYLGSICINQCPQSCTPDDHYNCVCSTLSDGEYFYESQSSQFLVAFANNYNNNNLRLFISAVKPDPVTVTVETLTGFSFTGVTTNNETLSIVIPITLEVRSTSERNKGISVTAEDQSTIVVYGLNYDQYTSDAFLALPCDRLPLSQYEYYGVSYSTGGYFLIVGCENDTEFQIGSGGTISLDRMQTYYWTSSSYLTGTRLVSNKPLVVYSGHTCTNVPSGYGACDHLTEQLPPTAIWGKTFLVASLAGRSSGDIYQFVTSQNATSVSVNCSTLNNYTLDSYTLASAASWQEINTPANSFCYISSDKPLLVMQFGLGYSLDGVGDPFMMMITPVSQFKNNYILNAMPEFSANYITIYVSPEDFQPQKILVDDFNLEDANWTIVYCPDSQICGYITQTSLPPGNHTVYHSDVTSHVGVSVYGFNDFNSYGYPAGLQFDHIQGSGSEIVDCGVPEAPVNGSISFSSTNYSSVANISCDEGYVLIGEDNRTCTQSGLWSNSDAECRRNSLQGSYSQFVVGFGVNYVGPDYLRLFISTDEPDPVLVTVETLTGFSFTGLATNNRTLVIEIPTTFMVRTITEHNKGILITAEDQKSIVVYGLNYEEHTSDAFLALPCHRLPVTQYEYYGVSYSGGGHGLSHFLVVGCENDTVFQIGSEEPFVLDRLQTYLWESSDFTGTRLVSNKPLVVYSGHRCTDIPSHSSACDHITEQVPPTAIWGTTFMSASFLGRASGDIYRFVASQNSTSVSVNCSTLSNVQTYSLASAGSWQEINTPANSFCYISSDKPLLVMQFGLGNSLDGIGDPFMMMITPVEQFSNNYVLNILQEFSTNYITIYVSPENYQPHSIFVDDDNLEYENWTTVYCPDFQICGHITQMSLLPGDHIVYHSDVTSHVGVSVYGFVGSNSYGYPAGLQFEPFQFVDCGPLDDPVNGAVHYVSNTALNSVAYYTCEGTYVLNRTCLINGTWSGSPPLCTVSDSDSGLEFEHEFGIGSGLSVDCGVPEAPVNGSVSFFSTNYSSVANISCDEGYVLVGEDNRTCMQSGLWSNSDTKCKRMFTFTLKKVLQYTVEPPKADTPRSGQPP